MMAYCNKSRSPVETRYAGAKSGNSTIERKWNDDPWLNDVKSMRGRSVEMSDLNTENREAKAAYSKHREFHMSPEASCSSYCTNNSSSTSSISSSCLSSDAEYFYRNSSSIPTAQTKRNSHLVASTGERACKWAAGGECFRDSHGKPSVRVGAFRSTEKPFNPTDHRAKIRSKSKTGKDSKKLKQPTSPAKKLAKFLISLFMAGGTKKANGSSPPPVSDSTLYDSSGRKPSIYSYYSSVQSRPCLSKTSKGYSNNRSGMDQKAVTFCQTIANVDWDFSPHGEKCLHGTENPAPYSNPCKGAYELPPLEKDRYAVAATTKDIIAKDQKENGIMEAVTSLDKQDKEEENDVTSCSSSDLFELKNLADIDMNMYENELPVYETTHWETNKAIAKGLIV